MALFEQLDSDITNLTHILGTWLESEANEQASRLPLLDRAKLYVQLTYAIEAIIFCPRHHVPSRLVD